MDFKPKVVVTGFGPFSTHVINDSGLCAYRIKDSGLEDELNIEIISEVLDVIYDKALDRVRDLWSRHNPFLVVHLGVHNKKKCITIEKCAHKQGYKDFDIKKKCPANGICPYGKHQRICTEVDVDSIIKKCNPSQYDLCSSQDAGLYLCEFVYYTSLSHDPSRVIFVHIPPYNEPGNLQYKVNVVKDIIKHTFLHLCEKEKINKT
ncbi:pyroglutamyl-peptidase 1 [Halyomorpha halys]|uniref:pyroglutamyl-peptidase 1 n=1 Tax=Halyomorpha halys TaxID=286706 RepID=UPI0006D4F39D|nr:pyroglutamyl-peptidase 1 [Halyomorpha halys]